MMPEQFDGTRLWTYGFARALRGSSFWGLRCFFCAALALLPCAGDEAGWGVLKPAAPGRAWDSKRSR
ncbi:hypothetical protein HNQ51_001929 [Inhella inkyongensis]|uniref:Uncharacterized protein n=1 Tax=Inhella inkyongensis TaxID=392593 RepID=A0A840S2S6_9BURK|nr:hypothetical protein [Inhella inkyongensis]MBB5204615.1 hypothetical protein [Inhella inkyongensis]